MSAPTTLQWLRSAVIRVYEGSVRLAGHLASRTIARGRALYRRVKTWVGESSGFDKGFRLALLLLAALLIRRAGAALGARVWRGIESGAWSWLMWAAAGVWVVAAYRVGRPGWTPKGAVPAAEPDDEDDPGEPDVEEPEFPVEQLPIGLPLPNIEDLRISLAKVGTPHAHVAVLAADIGTTPERVREALAKWQIPVEPVRMQGRGSSTGVKGGTEAHPALAPRVGAVGVVAAGQPANNDNNNAPGAGLEEGFRVERIGLSGAIVHDPTETVRHHEIRK